MREHLTEQEMSLACAGLELPLAAAAHLESCAGCRRRVAAFAEVASARRREQAAAEPDWVAQRTAILDRLGEAPVVTPFRRWQRARRIVLAAAAVLVLGVGLAVLVRRPAPAPHLTDRTVEQVLAEVNQTLASDAVPGFDALDPLVPDSGELEQVSSNNTSNAS